MYQVKTRGRYSIAFLALMSSAVVAVPRPERAHDRLTSSRLVGEAVFSGSTIVSMASGFQPALIYRKYPTTEAVVPTVTWQLSFGVLLESMDPSINMTLSLDPSGQNADVAILSDTASFVPQDGLYNNYDPLQHFEIVYTGALDPFLGPVDFLLTPDGFSDIPIRVHLNVTDQPGFPIPFFPSFTGSAALGDITGDGKMEVVASPSFGLPEGLYAFDHTGILLPGWPLRSEDADIVNQGFRTPVIVDLDADGQDEIVVLGFILRDVAGESASAGFETTQTLYVVEGSGAVRWQITDDFTPVATPAVADIDGDGALDILIGFGGNLRRYSVDGTPVSGWQVDAPADTVVRIPMIVDLDLDSSNGMEIVACTFVPAPTAEFQLHVWNADGSLHGPMWPRAVDACPPPTVIDLDRNPSNGQEIILAVDHDEDPPVDPKTGFLNTFSVFVWQHDGTDAAGWPHHFFRDPNMPTPDDRIIGPGTAGDVDGDGDIEVIVGTYGQGDPANGNLFLFHHDGTLDADWPQWAGTAQTPSEFGGPALADLDGDGLQEIITGSFRGAYAFRADGTLFEGFPRLTTDSFSQPTIADLDGDGRLEIVFLAFDGRLSVWHLLSPSPDPTPWPLFRQNPANTGARKLNLGSPIPAVSAVGMVLMFCGLLCAGAYIMRRSTPTKEL